MSKMRFVILLGLIVICLPMTLIVAEDSGAPAANAPVSAFDEPGNLSFVFKDHPLPDLLVWLHEKTNANISIDPASKLDTLKVTANVRNITWRQGLDYIAKKYEFEIEMDEYGIIVLRQPTRIDLIADNTDIRAVIMMIARDAGVNVVVDPTVTGNVTVYLKQVPWTVALDNVLRTTNFVAIREKYNTMLITSAAKLMEQPETRVFRLSYIEPSGAKYVPELDTKYATRTETKGPAAASLLEIIEAVIGKEGIVKYEAANNALIVRASKTKLDEVSLLIAELDKEPLQVSIEVRIYSASLEKIRDLGVRWQNGLILVANGAKATNAMVFPFTSGFDSWEGFLHNSATSGPFFSSDPVITPGSIDASTLSMELKLLETYTNAEVIQQPRITTLDNHAATIHIGDVIRYAEFEQSTSTSGSSTGGYKEASGSPVELGVQLLIIPHVARKDGNIMMTVIPKIEDARGGSLFETFGSGATEIRLPQTKTELVVSKMIVPDGNTAVLAGFVKNTNSINGNKIPLLGDIPGLGWLFKNRHSENVNDVLIIFITPTIISSETSKKISDEFQKIRDDLRKELLEKEGEAAKENTESEKPAEPEKATDSASDRPSLK